MYKDIQKMNKNVSKIYRWVSTVVLFPVTETPRWESVPLTISRTTEPTVDSRMDIFWRVFHIFTLHLEISVGPEGLLNFLLLSTLNFFWISTSRDPKIWTLRVRIYISSKGPRTLMEFRRFRDCHLHTWISALAMMRTYVCVWLSLSLHT